eukprot:PhF_6_TR26654/c0_g1_i1/m.38648
MTTPTFESREERDAKRIADLVLQLHEATSTVAELQKETRNLRAALHMKSILENDEDSCGGPTQLNPVRPKSAKERWEDSRGRHSHSQDVELKCTQNMLDDVEAEFAAQEAAWERERIQLLEKINHLESEIDQRNMRIANDVMNQRLLNRLEHAGRKYGRMKTMRQASQRRLEASERQTMEAHDDQRFVRVDVAKHVPVDDVTVVIIGMDVELPKSLLDQVTALIWSLSREHKGALGTFTKKAFMVGMRDALEALRFSVRLYNTLKTEHRYRQVAEVVRIAFERCRPEVNWNPVTGCVSYVGPQVTPVVKMAQVCHPGEFLIGEKAWSQIEQLDSTIGGSVVKSVNIQVEIVTPPILDHLTVRSAVLATSVGLRKTWKEETLTRKLHNDVIISWWSHTPKGVVDASTLEYAAPTYLRVVDQMRKTVATATHRLELAERENMEAHDVPVVTPQAAVSVNTTLKPEMCFVSLAITPTRREVSYSTQGVENGKKILQRYVQLGLFHFNGSEVQIPASSKKLRHFVFATVENGLQFSLGLIREVWRDVKRLREFLSLHISLVWATLLQPSTNVMLVGGFDTTYAVQLNKLSLANEILLSNTALSVLHREGDRVPGTSIQLVAGTKCYTDSIGKEYVWSCVPEELSTLVEFEILCKTRRGPAGGQTRQNYVDFQEPPAFSKERLKHAVEHREELLMSMHDQDTYTYEGLVPVGHDAVLVMMDIEGATVLRETLPMPFRVTLSDYRTIVRTYAKRTQGFELRGDQDCFLFCFPSIRSALDFSVEVQVALNSATWHDDINAHELSLRVKDIKSGQYAFNGPRVRMAVVGVPKKGTLATVSRDISALYQDLSDYAWHLVNWTYGGEIVLNQRAYEEFVLDQVQHGTRTWLHVGSLKLHTTLYENETMVSMYPLSLSARGAKINECRITNKPHVLRKNWTEKVPLATSSFIMKRRDMEQDVFMTLSDSELLVLSDMANTLTKRLDELSRYTTENQRKVDVVKVLGHIDYVIKFVTAMSDAMLPPEQRISHAAILDEGLSLHYTIITKKLLDQYDELSHNKIDLESLLSESPDLSTYDACPTCKRPINEKKYSRHEFKPSSRKDIVAADIQDVISDFYTADEGRVGEIGFDALKALFTAKGDNNFDSAVFAKIDKDNKGTVTPLKLVRYLYPNTKVTEIQALVRDIVKEMNANQNSSGVGRQGGSLLAPPTSGMISANATPRNVRSFIMLQQTPNVAPPSHSVNHSSTDVSLPPLVNLTATDTQQLSIPQVSLEPSRPPTQPASRRQRAVTTVRGGGR